MCDFVNLPAQHYKLNLQCKSEHELGKYKPAKIYLTEGEKGWIVEESHKFILDVSFKLNVRRDLF